MSKITESGIDLKQFLFKLVAKWYLFAISFAIGIAYAYYTVKTSPVIYKFVSTIMVETRESGSKGAGELLNVISELRDKRIITNEIGVIRSFSLVKEAVKRLDLRVSYYTADPQKNKKKDELYKTGIPIKVEVDTNARQVVNIPFKIKFLNDKEYRLLIDNDGEELKAYDPEIGEQIKLGTPNYKVNKRLRFGERYEDKYFNFRILRTEEAKESNMTELFAQVNDLNSVAKKFHGSLDAKQEYTDSFIIGLRSRGSISSRQIDFLNTLMEVYISQDLKQKNLEAKQALEFIEEKLEVADEALANSEAILAQFKSQKAIVDQASQANSASEVLEDYILEKDRVERQLQGYLQIQNQLESSDDLTSIPASAALTSGQGQDVYLNRLLADWVDLNQRKASLSLVATEESPEWKKIDSEAKLKKSTAINYIKQNIQAVRTKLRSIDRQIARSEVKIKQIPADSKDLDDLQRRFDNDNKNYQFLLDKRTEAEIGLATNAPDSRVIDTAKREGRDPVAPNKKLIYMIALFLAFVIPTGFILVTSYLSDKVSSKGDLAQESSIPFLATIARDDASVSKKKKKSLGVIPVVQRPKSLITESFRLLRIKIEDLNIYSNSKIVGVTSSVEGEGKTYCSVNLSAIYAMANYKTLLISADLYRPKVNRYFNFEDKAGLSDYLDNNASIEKIIHPSSLENLDVIVAGQYTSNPSELLSMQKIGVLLDELRQVYQCIIIDTPPTEYVSDYFVLKNYLDVTLYLVRYNYTRSKLLSNITELYEEDKVANLYLVLNDVKYSSVYDSQMKKKKNSYYHRDGKA